MGEDECDEGKARSSFVAGGKLHKQQETSLGLFNILQTVSLISESPRFHKPWKENQVTLKISFLKWKDKASRDLRWPLVNTYEYSSMLRCQNWNININPCWNTDFQDNYLWEIHCMVWLQAGDRTDVLAQPQVRDLSTLIIFLEGKIPLHSSESFP